MNAYQIINALRSGRVLYMTGRGTSEEEATLGILRDRGLITLRVVNSNRGQALEIRWKQRERRFVRVRVVVPTWYGARIVEQIVEVGE